MKPYAHLKLTIRELTGMTPDERDNRIAEFCVAVWHLEQGTIEERLSKLNKEISELESKYGITSEDMVKNVSQGQLPSTAELHYWRIIVDMRLSLKSQVA